MVKLYEAMTYIGDWQVVPGEVFERDIPEEQEAWLLHAGAIRVAELIPDFEPSEEDRTGSNPEEAAKEAPVEAEKEAPEEATEEDPDALAEVAAVDCADAVGTRKSSGRRKRA